MKILLVEDDSTLAMGIEYTLKNEGYDIEIANTYKAAINKVENNPYDLLILDVGLPDGNGFDICRNVRKTKSTPIIFLTAEDEEVNIVMGLDIGGDDYITKPFRIRELLSRIKAILRRTNSIENKIIISGDIRINLIENKVYNGDELLWLTPSEYKLLVIFMTNSKIALTRNRILEDLWDIDGDFIDDNTLSVYIRRLREKIELDSSNPEYIKTIRGVGYIWNVVTRGE